MAARVPLLGHVSVKKNEECAFRRLMLCLLLPETRGKPSTTLQLISGMGHSTAPYGYRCPIFTIYQDYPDQMEGLLDDLEIGVMKLGCVAQIVSETKDEESGVRKLQLDSIEYAILHEWIECCRANHGEKCSPPDVAGESEFRLIDCVDRTIVRTALRPSCPPYVAMSYVWGPNYTPSPRNTDSNHQLERLPQTLEDAITVTKALAFRYLWIDQYCIWQDDEDDRKVQIAQMDLIYSLAEITIIIAAGSDPTYGLPGVSTRTREPQPTAVVGGRTLVWDFGSPKQYIERSTWNSRGWTYQEGHFSRRRLIFTDQQVYFECRVMYCCEARFEILKDIRKEHRPKSLCLYPVSQAGTVAFDFHSRLSEYTSRNFGHDSDILNGFKGLLHEFERLPQPIYNLWGVAIPSPDTFRVLRSDLPPRTSSDCFLVGLCWTTRTTARRREGFPSWSWAGWIHRHAAEYYCLSTPGWEGRSGITVWLKSERGEQIDWDEFTSGFGLRRAFCPVSQTLTLTAGQWQCTLTGWS